LLCAPSPLAPRARAVFDFVGFGRKAAIIPVIVIVAGGWYYSNHGLNLDIDFTAGTALDIDLENSIEQAEAEAIMTEAGIVPATVSIGGDGNRHIAARFDEILKPEELRGIINAFKARYGTGVNYEENTADPGVAREFATKAIYALLAACASIVIYIGIRFSWPVGMAILVSIIHDLLLVCAIFSLFKLEIDVTYVAAMLTVMGYSLNDKIVIFDRIRENIRKHEGSGDIDRIDAARKIANVSIQQTLGRSIYTVLTVVLASASLLALACEPLQMFSLAILLGLVFGAYSSIFLACPLWIAARTLRMGAKLTPDLVRL
jgi:preprotein translocase SecF subunit